jgi:protein-tyrosine-phosphatase
MAIKKILCVCLGNSDRSPVMAAVLGMFLKNAGHEVIVESAGALQVAEKGGPPSKFAFDAAHRLGLDISGHVRRYVKTLDLSSYDLIVCASDEIAGEMVSMGVDIEKVYNAQVPNPWPVHFERDYEGTMTTILGAMYKVVVLYF